MTSSLTLGVVQFSPSADSADNLSVIAERAASACADGASIVVFPEYSQFFDGPMGPSYVAAAEPLDGPFSASVSSIASSLGIVIVIGLLEAGKDGRVRNTVVAYGADGIVLAVYRKMHLYDAFGTKESEWLEPGAWEGPAVFDLDGVRFGVQTCYDVRFPEVSRALVDAGADVLLVPAEWVPGPAKELHWSTLLTARAIENTAFVVAVDQSLPGGIGSSLVIDPSGRESVRLGDGAESAVVSLDLTQLEATRVKNPALALRRFSVVWGAPQRRTMSGG